MGKQLIPGLGVWGTLYGLVNLIIFGLTLGLLSNMGSASSGATTMPSDEWGVLLLGIVVIVNAGCCGVHSENGYLRGGGLIPLGYGIYVAYRLHEKLINASDFAYPDHVHRARNIAISIAVFGGLQLALDTGYAAYDLKIGRKLGFKY